MCELGLEIGPGDAMPLKTQPDTVYPCKLACTDSFERPPRESAPWGRMPHPSSSADAHNKPRSDHETVQQAWLRQAYLDIGGLLFLCLVLCNLQCLLDPRLGIGLPPGRATASVSRGLPHSTGWRQTVIMRPRRAHTARAKQF